MSAVNVVVIGSANMDLILRVPRIPKTGESLVGSDFLTAHGGKGANQALAAARLGARAQFIGCVGRDDFGRRQREGLASAGVDVSEIIEHPELPTGTALILVTDDGDNAIVVIPAANLGLTPEHIERARDVIRRADVLITQLEVPLETVEAALCVARECGVYSVLDAGPARAVPDALLSAASLVSPNETEAEAITGITVDSSDSALAAAERLRAMGAREVALKLGARGCLYLGGKGLLQVPAFTVNAVDPTAAGDAFTAALAVSWERMTFRESLRFANATGALAATVTGAQPSMPSLESVRRFLAEADATAPG